MGRFTDCPVCGHPMTEGMDCVSCSWRNMPRTTIPSTPSLAGGVRLRTASRVPLRGAEALRLILLRWPDDQD